MASTTTSARKSAGRKPAAKLSTKKKATVSKAATRRRVASKKTTAARAAPSRFSFPSIDQMIASTRAALNDHESALGKAEQIVEKARAAMGDAEKILLERTRTARAKGTAAAKSAMKKAKLQRKKADKMVVVAKGKYKELKASYDSSMVKLKKITLAQEKLLSDALKEEQKLFKKLLKAEGKLLKSVNDSAPVKIARKKVARRKSATPRRSRMAAAPA
jgi:hypothetical protein